MAAFRGSRPHPSRRRPSFGHALALALSASFHAGPADAEQYRVLTLHAARRETQFLVIADQTLQRVLGQSLRERLDYYSEFIDVGRFPNPSHPRTLRGYLRSKYADQRFDVVIATSNSALALVDADGDELFVDAPRVFYASPNFKAGGRSTGVTSGLDLARTVLMTTRLQPEVRRVVVVSGSSALDQYYANLVRAQLTALAGRLEVGFWSGLPMPELLRRVADMPEHSALYYLMLTEDGSGQRFLPQDSFDLIAGAANAPIYSSEISNMGRGAIGGSLFSAELVATHLARLALRVLAGEQPEAIPVIEIDPLVDEVDWRQLRRFGIDEARVPAGTAVRFREPGIWERYRSQVVGTAALVLVQTALIAGLLVQRARRRRVESALRESEGRFRAMADTAPVMVWRSRTDKACDFFNKPWLEFRGRTMEQELGAGWVEGVHPEDLEACLATYSTAFDERRAFSMEYRLLRSDGEYRWVLGTGVPRFAPDAAFAGFIGSCIDITERRRAEFELRDSELALRRSHQQNQDLAGRLISAQEVERARIARELHDDAIQQLAGLSIVLGGLRQRLKGAGPPDDVDETLGRLNDRVATLADGLRTLSHELHSGVLEHAGLVAALKQHCREFARHHSLDVSVSAGDDGDALEPEVALCLYRVAQEALSNTARHARARAARVRLERKPGSVELDIVDDGLGFDPVGRDGSGLGLRSIAERVRLARGSVTIESQPGQGTRVQVRIPIADVGRLDRARVS